MTADELLFGAPSQQPRNNAGFDDDLLSLDISPQNGGTSGGQTVTLTLSKPLPQISHSLFVKFGTTLGRASSFSGTVITVVSPPHAPGRVVVSISADQKKWSKKGVHFEYIQENNQNPNKFSLNRILYVAIIVGIIVFVASFLKKTKRRRGTRKNAIKNTPLVYQRDESPREDTEKAPFIPKKRTHTD